MHQATAGGGMVGTAFSLREVLAGYAPLLLIDSSSSVVFVGVWRTPGESPVWERCEEEAGSGVFRGVERALAKAGGLTLAEVRGFAFGEGPGSVLGIRTAAAAIRTWRAVNPGVSVFSFQGLSIVTEALARPGMALIVDARRDSWHVARAGQPLARMASADLAALAGGGGGEGLALPEGFRHWTPAPAGAVSIPYDLPEALTAMADRPFFRPTTEPEAFLYDVPQYALWTPKVHQAPDVK
ncbi:peptidase M22 [Geminisphaera colitermitum]|uniref:peptidase M22 n=1 Tax=Geminisphaera colitermitum TaxID=1148786 RepID=UPI0022B7DD20|nr:peptidase M22 [Geminisphaera colitermitum]